MDLLEVATPVTAFVIVGVVVVAALAITAHPGEALRDDVAAARRHSLTAGAAAVGLGLTATAVMVNTQVVLPGVGWVPGLGELLAPLSFGLVHTLVLWVGELTWPRPHGRERRAVLTSRTLSTLLQGWLARLGLAALLLAVVVPVVGSLLDAEDGRTIGYGQNQAPGLVLGQVTTGPFPGEALAVPALVGVVVLACVGLAALRTVAHRPAVSGDPASERALRQASTHRVMRGVVAALLVLDAGLLFYAGTAAYTAFPEGPAHHVGLVVGALGALLGLLGLVLLCIPAPRVRPADPAGDARRGQPQEQLRTIP